MPNTSQSLQSILESALLSQAAYADLSSSVHAGTLSLAATLQQSGMSAEAAQYIANRFEVVSFEDESGLFDSGYSGTFFRRRQGIAGSPEFVFALRGTSPSDPMDLLTDWILVGGGALSEGQTADMQAHFDTVRTQFDFGIGDVDVTGHSLGGYLTTVLAGDLNRQDYIRHGFTFNGIGYFDGPDTLPPALMSRILEEVGVVSPAIASPKLSNFFGTAGVELAAGLLTLVGSNDGVFIEDSLDPLRLHGIKNVVTGITCYRLLTGLDPSASWAQCAAILSACSNDYALDYERFGCE